MIKDLYNKIKYKLWWRGIGLKDLLTFAIPFVMVAGLFWLLYGVGTYVDEVVEAIETPPTDHEDHNSENLDH